MKKLILILISIVILTGIAKAEEEKRLYYLGGYLGYNVNLHFPEFAKLPPLANCCPKPGFENGNGGGLAIGALAQMEITNSVLLGLRLGYTQMDGTIEREVSDNNVSVIANGTDTYRDLVLNHSMEGSFSMINIEPNINFYFFESLSTFLGFRFGYMMDPTVYQQEQILAPEDIVFIEDNRVIRNDRDTALPSANNFQIHGMIGFGIDLPVFGDAVFTPELRYYLPLMEVTSLEGVKWSVSQLQLGASLKFPIYNEVTKPSREKYVIERDTIFTTSPDVDERITSLIDRDTSSYTMEFEEEEIVEIHVKENYETVLPQESYIQASIKAVGIDKNGKEQDVPKIVIEEIEVEEGFPLLPYVFFENNSADLNQTGQNLITKDAVDRFTEGEMSWNTLDIYSDMLNIIGERLKKNPKAKITIVGNNNNLGAETNNLELSKNRAEVVRNYLVDVWGINKSRIKLEKRNLPIKESNNDRADGQVENQRAEIYSNDLAIIQPVFLKDIRKESSPPVVMLIPYINSDKDIANWNISVNQNNKQIRNYSGSGEAAVQQWSVVEEPIPALEKPIDITLEAENAKGKKAKSQVQVQIEQKTIYKKREEIHDDKKFERYSLIVFDYDKSDLTDNHKKVLDQIKNKVKPESEVIISGYTDRTGELAYNKQLAQRRCEEVKNYLNLKNSNIKLNPVGSDKLLYDNDLPQGRYYSRTVKIEIITPIK
jgi:outer membrane protein OmpA-like peptidoglycan-associated protein